jgi:hypothetical protein
MEASLAIRTRGGDAVREGGLRGVVARVFNPVATRTAELIHDPF